MKKICWGINSIVILPTTKKTTARRPKRYNKIINRYTEIFKEGIEVKEKVIHRVVSREALNESKKTFD